MKHAYIDKAFKASSLEIIQQADEIIEEYQRDGLDLTLRQLYYQFVSRDLLPNSQKSYKRLGSIISDARLAGHLDWTAIEDRTRELKANSHWTDPGSIIRACVHSFKLDHWEGQEHRLEVWIEKEALSGVISSICSSLDVPYFACKGYVSQSEMWRAAQRLRQYDKDDPRGVIIHLGDHDPSGIDMTRDIEDRMTVFGANVEVKRIALNMPQIEQYSPPPNPAKVTDSRVTSYITEYGSESWELDALEPRVLRNLIKDIVEDHRDDDIYEEVLERERQYIRTLEFVEKNWQDLDV